MHFAQSKSTKCEILAASWTPPNIKTEKKNINLHREKVFTKGFQICTCRVFGYADQVMHYVRTLCDKYFLSYDVFSACFYGKVKILGSETWCRVKWDPRRTAAYVPSHFHGFEPHFLLMCLPKIVIFQEPAYHRDSQQVPLDLACLEP